MKQSQRVALTDDGRKLKPLKVNPTTMKTLFLAAALLCGVAIPAYASDEGRCVAQLDAIDDGANHAKNVKQCHAIWGPDSDFPTEAATPPAAFHSAAPAYADVNASLNACIATANSANRNDSNVISICQIRVKMYEDLARAVPQWAQINNSPAFAQWLDQVDPISRQPRRNFLNKAYNQNNTGQVIDVFNNFISAYGDGNIPSPQVAMTNHVPIAIEDRAAYVKVNIGGVDETMMIDTGASSGSITQSTANWLLGKGQASEGPVTTVTYADGHTAEGRSVVVNDFVIGGHILHNVRFGVEKDGTQPLLGFNTLSQVTGKFAINVASSTLDFE